MKVGSTIALIGGLALMGIVGYTVSNITQPKPAPAPVVKADMPPPIPLVKVLVAKSDLVVGTSVRKEDLHWQSWPAESVAPTYVTRGDSLVDAIQDLKKPTIADFTGTVVRLPIAAGQPMTPGFVARATKGGGAVKTPVKATAPATRIRIYRGTKLQVVKFR